MRTIKQVNKKSRSTKDTIALVQIREAYFQRSNLASGAAGKHSAVLQSSGS